MSDDPHQPLENLSASISTFRIKRDVNCVNISKNKAFDWLYCHSMTSHMTTSKLGKRVTLTWRKRWGRQQFAVVPRCADQVANGFGRWPSEISSPGKPDQHYPCLN
jgi:hypothetical protein